MVVLRISEICKEKGITTQQLNDLTGIPYRTLEGYRASRSEPSLSVGLKIADALGVDPHELFIEAPDELKK